MSPYLCVTKTEQMICSSIQTIVSIGNLVVTSYQLHKPYHQRTKCFQLHLMITILGMVAMYGFSGWGCVALCLLWVDCYL